MRHSRKTTRSRVAKRKLTRSSRQSSNVTSLILASARSAPVRRQLRNAARRASMPRTGRLLAQSAPSTVTSSSAATSAGGGALSSGSGGYGVRGRFPTRRAYEGAREAGRIAQYLSLLTVGCGWGTLAEDPERQLLRLTVYDSALKRKRWVGTFKTMREARVAEREASQRRGIGARVTCGEYVQLACGVRAAGAGDAAELPLRAAAVRAGVRPPAPCRVRTG